MTSLKPAPCIVDYLSIMLSHNVNESIVHKNGQKSGGNAKPWDQVVVLVVTMVWDGQEARGGGHLQGLSRLPNFSQTFHQHLYFLPLKSRQQRFCCHLDLPSCKTHGFACHILLHLTYFRFCVWKITVFRSAEYSECPLTSPGNGTDCCHLWHPSLPPEVAWLRRAVRSQ